MKYQIIALDIDGTLLGSDNKISPATRTALDRAYHNGLKVILCTGRRFRTARRFSIELGFDAPIVTNCGALIKNPQTEETLYRNALDVSRCEALMHFLLERSDSVVTYLDTPLDTNRDFVICDRASSSASFQKYLAIHRGLYYLLPDGRLPEGSIPIGICVIEDRERLNQIEMEVQKHFGSSVQEHIMGSVPVLGPVLEMFAPGTTKWNALCTWAETLDVHPDGIVAAGDEMNDMEMISKAGLGAAMGNARQEIKDVADLVLPSNDEDGIVALVQHLLESMEEK
ncbi:MAG TPA: Cof-type HAD-IIB family hydrolase [bacterium]|nr:Cof-type HAD-IIB family hydrolase [bacterium]